MGALRTHVVMPEELAKEIDALVGPRGRSAFLVQTAEAEVKRRRLIALLRGPEPLWKDEDHPDMADGSAAWVKRLRAENASREAIIEAAWNRKD